MSLTETQRDAVYNTYSLGRQVLVLVQTGKPVDNKLLYRFEWSLQRLIDLEIVTL